MLRFIATILILAFLMAPLEEVQARYFDANDIFTDKELFDSNSLSRTAIQQFLEAKNSVLKSVTALVNGVPKLVSEMIYEIGKQYGVSQKFLLAKLQHEQGLIEKETASQNAIDWATGYSCYNKRCNEKYRGIYAQLDAAADTQRIYAERTYFSYSVGKETKTTDGFKVKPANQATANLYIYTPYQGGPAGIGGNYAFWRVWSRYFTERPFAEGALLIEQETGNYWKIENNKRRQFASADIYLKDYRPEDAIIISSNKLSYYQASAPVEFANNAIVKGAGSNLLYLLSNNTKQRIVGEQALALLGYRLADTVPVAPALVPEEKLAAFPEGEPITEQSVYPQGVLAQNESGAMFLIKQGQRYPILDEAVWQMNFKKDPPLRLLTAEIEKYPPADPIKLRDGSVVKSGNGNFYLISKGKKQLITSTDVARRFLGDEAFGRVLLASDAILALHESGDAVDFINAAIADPVPYISYADRVGISSAAPDSRNYLAVFEKVQSPKSILLGETKKATVSFRNTGTLNWEPGKVIFELVDEASAGSSFTASNQVALARVVRPGEIAEFNFDLTTASSTPGILNEWFALEYQNDGGVFVPMPGAKVRQSINVIAPISGQIVSSTIPKSISKKKGKITVIVKVKNTSQKQIWTSRRTALILTAADGSNSLFYDKYDWVDKTVVGVPVNYSKIKPGQTGFIYFRLDPKKAPLGTATLRFTMELRDVKEKVYLNNGVTWETTIKVVK
ncbi:MAG: hypothetical protein A3H70_03580 [Candidatus Komeilibacteria bacterium RIFCSPLOWO2_02_FULL_48_11]|uniref:Uncharacterized protein n=1 Tax=Candidatus Komeilibacteria bacterium RIFCSPLOWO2_02_FULL_48_11 TaxID=1798553 RepID=A0A1G2BT99_9BACT|nr:MAG: hypothetical protein A3H70_03580 [Candidatus Komeilibacteria bacterium RIFCSPLOWO2_02_FULL_48_11]